MYIDNPTEIEREEIFKIHMATVKIGDNLKESYAARLAACTPGMVFQDSHISQKKHFCKIVIVDSSTLIFHLHEIYP